MTCWYHYNMAFHNKNITMHIKVCTFVCTISSCFPAWLLFAFSCSQLWCSRLNCKHSHMKLYMSKISQITFFDLHVVECHHLVTHTSVVSLSTSASQLPFLTLHSCCRATFCCFSCSICSVCMCTKCICALYLELTYCTSVSFCS